MNNSLLVVLVANGIGFGTPLLYASLGELLAERSGVLNLGVEGMMLIGAVMGFWAVQRFHFGAGLSLAAAVGVAALAGAAVALIHAFLVITMRASQIVSGLAITIFAGAAGLSSYLANDLNLANNPAAHQFQEVFPSSMRDWPVVGPIVFGHNVLVYIHKELELEDVERRYPAEHYALVDDKVRILAAVKEVWGDRVTTIFPRQGHYAHDAEQLARYPAPDVTVEHIGDVLKLER